MLEKSSITFKIFIALAFFFTLSCSKLNKYQFYPNPKNESENVSTICKNTDASHFTVENHKVNFKKKDGGIIKLKHFKTLLPDGYYLCSLQSGNSLILD